YLESVYSAPLSVKQQETLRNNPVIGPLWVSKCSLPNPKDDTSRHALLRVVQVPYDRPASNPLNLEWVGFRSNVQKETPEPLVIEKEKFDKLNAETKSSSTVFYIYGGTFVQNTLSCYRKMVANLSQATGAKVMMVEQRLAPQNPFPAALLDVFQAYLALLYPPLGSYHKPTPPSSGITAGITPAAAARAGRHIPLVHLHPSSKSPILPAGMALLNPICDASNAFPSFERNAYCDIFPIPIDKLPYLQKEYPTDNIWSTRPPRANFYCEAGMLAHPLVSSAAAEDWAGSCPMWMGFGQEQVQDPARTVARELHRAGISVTLREYECMPHSFFLAFRNAPQTKQLLGMWAQAVVQFGKGNPPPSTACFVRAGGLKEESLDIDNFVEFSATQARELMWEKTHCYKVPPFHREGSRSNL
ncbi:hypothetical protein N7451_006460, partial [Penicillium sp. IBT 35674x]